MREDQKTRLDYRTNRTKELKDKTKKELIRLAKRYFNMTFDERTKNDDIVKAIVDAEVPYPYVENGALEDVEVPTEGKPTDDGGKDDSGAPVSSGDK